MKQENYSSIRPTLHTGDLVAFGGQNFVSASIKAFTNSHVSHVGMVLNVVTSEASLPIVTIVESIAVFGGFSGVHISRLSTRVANYNGEIWILPVDKSMNIAAIEAFLISKLGIAYDYKQVFGAAFDYPFSREQQEDLSQLFCSELCNEVYSQYLPDIPEIPTNSSEQTPIDVCRLPIYADIYQVAGKPKELF